MICFPAILNSGFGTSNESGLKRVPLLVNACTRVYSQLPREGPPTRTIAVDDVDIEIDVLSPDVSVRSGAAGPGSVTCVLCQGSDLW